MCDIFSDNIQRGDLLTAETFQNIHSFLKGSNVAGGSVSAQGINVPSEFVRNPRTVRFIAEEAIETHSIIELTEQVEDASGIDNQVPTFKAKPANGDSGTLFYTESTFADTGEAGMAYSIGGEPILIRSSATEDGSPDEGKIVANPGGAFRYLGESDVSELKWFLPVQGGGVSEPKSSKVRLVQPKELFPACEYKTFQPVYGCWLEYSDDGESWILVGDFHCGTRDVVAFEPHEFPPDPHKYWRVDLKGFSKPEDPNDENADRGFYTFGRLWEARFWVERNAASKKTVIRQIDKHEKEETEYTFSAIAPDNWRINSREPLAVELAISPEVENGELFYKTSTGDWESKGAFSSADTFMISAEDIQITIDKETGKERYNTSFSFRVEQTVDEYNPAFNEEEEESSDNKKLIPVTREMGNLILKRPAYKLSPDDAENALPPPREDIDVEHLFFDSKPVPRKAQNHRFWTLTFDQPEVVTHVMLDVDQHVEHYIICPGGRNANKQAISLIYSLDLASEKWTGATFPEMHEPMFNMDAKVVALLDGTHQLIVLSGQIAKGFSNIIQGYNFEKDYIKAPIDLGELGINFAGRPALVGDQMLRNVGTTVILPDEETNFLRSLIVIGGGERSVAATPGGSGNSTLDSVLFSVRGETLAVGSPYRIQTQNMAISNIGHTGLPFGRFEYKSYVGSTNDVITRLQRMGTYARHQNLPVRGILRRRPLLSNGNVDTLAPSSSKPVVDFLLIGGFNEGVNREEYNKKVVSGIFNAMTWSASGGRTQTFYTLAIAGVTEGWDSFADRFLYYPPCGYVLGDCCAEYVFEEDENGNVMRDEIICFGGRSHENDTALAHEELAVLDFMQTTPTIGNKELEGKWLYDEDEHEYPPMPHPRWSAASVLIKDLVRTGETEPCTRIFMIGGRNRDGFVAEVDVFNLRYNIWETDWKGLLDGELETVPASLGGGSGTTIVIGGGGGNDCKAISNARIDQIMQAHGF